MAERLCYLIWTSIKTRSTSPSRTVVQASSRWRRWADKRRCPGSRCSAQQLHCEPHFRCCTPLGKSRGRVRRSSESISFYLLFRPCEGKTPDPYFRYFLIILHQRFDLRPQYTIIPFSRIGFVTTFLNAIIDLSFDGPSRVFLVMYPSCRSTYH